MRGKTHRSVFIEEVRKEVNGKQYVSTLLRRTYRDQGKVKHETLGSLNDLPADLIAVMKQRLLSGQPITGDGGSIAIEKSLPHGHVAAVLQTMEAIGLPSILSSRPCRERDLVLAMIADRILSPGSKLSCARGIDQRAPRNSLGDELGLGDVDVHEFYKAMDWLLARQNRIENKLAKRHLQNGSLVLFDVSSTAYTGSKSSLRQHGHSRDHRSDLPQIVYGLLCDRHGRPVSVEVLPGNTADPRAFSSLVQRMRKRFGISSVVFVGDRGMITSKRIDEDLRGVDGLHWITALRSEAIRALAKAGHVSRSLFDEKNLFEVRDDNLFPGERLIVCRNPGLADERARKRVELLEATERELLKIVKATQRIRNPLSGEANIALRVGKVISRHKMEKHFELKISDKVFTFQRREKAIQDEAALDGIYLIRTSVPQEQMTSEEAVTGYKSLSSVERAFRSMKSVDLKIRPIHHSDDDRIRSHVFLCMLAYYTEWHMRQQLKELLFDDEEIVAAQEQRASVVAAALRSESAEQKDASKTTSTGLPVQSFQDLLKSLSTQCRNTVRFNGTNAVFIQLTETNPLQRRAFELLRGAPPEPGSSTAKAPSASS